MESTRPGLIIGTFFFAAVARIDSGSVILFPISKRSSVVDIRSLFVSGMLSKVLYIQSSKPLKAFCSM